MAHDDQFTALGPPLAGSGMPRSAFSSKAAGMVFGANVQGTRAGVYGESVQAETEREVDVPGVGVYGVGENFGVFGKINPSAPGVSAPGQEVAAVYGQHHRGRTGVIGAAMPSGPDAPNAGTGVAGLSVSSLLNPLRFRSLPDPADGAGTGVFGSSGSGAGVLGTSRTSAGVRGESEDGDAVIGKSAAGRGGVFESGTTSTGSLVGQVGLVPQPMPVPQVVRAAPVMFDPQALTSLPREGRGGDLLATQAPDGRCTLWFCVRGHDAERPADWREVLLGRPTADQALTQIAWAHSVTGAAGLGTQDPNSVLGGPDGATLTLVPGATATLGAFQPAPVRDLTQLLNAATIIHGDVVSPADLARADVIAFERNGGAPASGGGWESCNWTFADGVTTLTVVWDGRADAARDSHVLANGSIRGAAYTDHFGIVPASPEVAIPPEEVISFLVFAAPELAIGGPGFTVRVSGTPSPAPGQEATPDIDTIGMIPRSS